MNQLDEGHKRKILIGIVFGVLVVAGAITVVAWPRRPKPTFVPHVEPAEVDQEEVVDEPKVRELRQRPEQRRNDTDTVKEPRGRKKKENKKIPMPKPAAGMP